MKRFLGYALLGLVAYMIFMIILFPAATLSGLLVQRLPGLVLQEVEGSALRGSAQGVYVQRTRFSSLSWRWRPLAVLGGRIEYRLIAEGPAAALQGRVGIGLDRQIRVSDLNGRLPLARAAALLEWPALLLDGYLELDLTELELDDAGRLHAAEGMLRLVDAHTTVGNSLALGDFSIQLTTNDQGILGTVADHDGPVELMGSLTFSPDSGYRFNGQIAARDKTDRQLQETLSMLGRPIGDGRWQVEFAGTL